MQKRTLGVVALVLLSFAGIHAENWPQCSIGASQERKMRPPSGDFTDHTGGMSAGAGSAERNEADFLGDPLPGIARGELDELRRLARRIAVGVVERRSGIGIFF